MVKVVALDSAMDATPRKSWLGAMEGEIEVPDDFDAMFQDEINCMFEGESKGMPD